MALLWAPPVDLDGRVHVGKDGDPIQRQRLTGFVAHLPCLQPRQHSREPEEGIRGRWNLTKYIWIDIFYKYIHVLYLFIYLYVCPSTYLSVCLSVCIFMHVCILMYVCMYVRMYVCMYVCIFMYVCILMYVCMYV